jgi:2-methylaconitate cis-trans-isomerase PrpF
MFKRTLTLMSAQNSLPCSYYRGGTSRAVIFQRRHLPPDSSQWPSIFLKVIGSPDPYGRQLNGMGVGISSLSKVCVVAPSAREDADVDYTFYGIGIENDEVDAAGNCGKMSAAIGPFMVDQGILGKKAESGIGEESVRIFNTNTGKIIRSRFGTVAGEARVEGTFLLMEWLGRGHGLR